MSAETKPKLLPLYLIGAASISFVQTVVSLIGYFTTEGSYVMVSLLLLAGPQLFSKKRFTPGIIALLSTCIAGLLFCRIGAFDKGHVVRDLSVTEAPLHHEAAAFLFRDGQVMDDLRGESISESTTKDAPRTRTYFYAAPLVTTPWTKASPVSAWVACINHGCYSEWKKPHKAGLRIVLNPDAFQNAVVDAEHRHGLHTVPDAPLMEWVADPMREILEFQIISWLAIVVGQLTWLILVLRKNESFCATIAHWVARARGESA